MEYTINIRKLLAENIRTLRTELHLTQQELAEQTGVIPLTISNIERGDAWPKPETLAKIAQALQIQPYKLFLDSKNDKMIPTDQVIKDNSRLLAMLKSELEKNMHAEITESSESAVHDKSKKAFLIKHPKK
jgi:transcriptional regulator with XRE-family HTH domain